MKLEQLDPSLERGASSHAATACSLSSRTHCVSTSHTSAVFGFFLKEYKYEDAAPRFGDGDDNSRLPTPVDLRFVPNSYLSLVSIVSDYLVTIDS